jgi:hypothetical protein
MTTHYRGKGMKMKRKKLYFIIGMVFLGILSTSNQVSHQETRILFDEYHAEWKPSLQFSEFIWTLEAKGYIIEFSDQDIDSYLLSRYNTLVLLTPSREFKTFEKEAIRTFVENGGGLILFGEEERILESEDVIDPLNSISSMFGITFNSDTVSDPELENQVPDTELTRRDPDQFVIIKTFKRHDATWNIFNLGYIIGCSLDVSSPAVELAFGNPTTIADSKEGEEVVVMAGAEFGLGKVVAIGDKDFLVGGSRRFGSHDGFLPYGDNERLGLSIVEWVSTSSTEPADSDSDGVPNSTDQCHNPGCKLVGATGCPKDSDNDGLIDCDDRCPGEAGSSTNYGCPASAEDTDNDGVPNNQDQCYNPECTIVDTTGCPLDSDNDTIDDCEDQCPNQYGEQNNGCPSPDSDGDTVPDDRDQCYNPQCSTVDANGCPKDSDNDGVNDCQDNCPTQAGDINNNGCPQQGPQFCAGTLVIAVFIGLGGILVSRNTS